ncbi:CHAP domain-containing protein [Pedobacter insulae]|uniref:CHAP domain-containing protein n=1 Tax=Pedobacter insulae TaxID=414048 RepID=A0A1I2TBS0_9SPHI|nr:CHAP domain-containing protein [Pedobacter insulae]SFG62325.1 CHAP domain-containing protein [Pedobacter insulae]
MAKINHFSQLLLLSVIGIYPDTGSDTLRTKVKQIYTSQIGVREQGNNSGPAVEKYLAYTGLAKGNPWCAAFVCWVYGQAGITNPQTGWSPSLFPATKVIWDRGKQKKPPAQADIFAIYFADKGRIAHTGFIDSWDNTWLITVEGNTNTQGSREGDGVYRKRRLVKSIYQVARYVN